jgi:hypothetical protein
MEGWSFVSQAIGFTYRKLTSADVWVGALYSSNWLGNLHGQKDKRKINFIVFLCRR